MQRYRTVPKTQPYRLVAEQGSGEAAHLPLGVEGGVAGDDDIAGGIQAAAGDTVQPDELLAHELRQRPALEAVPVDHL